MPTTILDMKAVTNVIGGNVQDAQGDVLGKIENIIVDVETGRVAYAIVSKAGVLGLNKKLFAVPWQAFRPGMQRNAYVLDVDRDILKNAPEIDPDHLPDWTNLHWNTDMYNHYHVQPFWSRSEDRTMAAEQAATQQAADNGGLLP